MSLTPRHALLVYLWEAILFTCWPFNSNEQLYSSTNLICLSVYGGLVSSAVLFTQKRMYCLHPDSQGLFAGRCWDYSTQIRKLCVILFYVQPVFIVLCSLLYIFIYHISALCTVKRNTAQGVPPTGPFCPGGGGGGVGPLGRHCVDLLLIACILARSILNNKCLHFIPYCIQKIFFAEDAGMSYLFDQVYLLTMFVFLY